jgi:hypothetical protein
MLETHLEKATTKRPFEDDGPEKQGDRAFTDGLPAGTNGKKKIVHRGTRSRKAQNNRRQKYVDSGGPERARNVINNLTGMNYLYTLRPDD